MNNKSLVVSGINFRNIRLAYIFTAIVILAIIVQDIVMYILSAAGVVGVYEDNSTVALGNYFFLIIIFGAIFIPSLNFRKMMNLGGKRADFFKGCAVTYVIMAAAVSLANMLFLYTYDRLVSVLLYGGGTLDVMRVFGWMANGPIVAFLQQFAFLLLFAAVLHTLTAAQDKWYGWAADVLIVAIISVFTPIAPLRATLVWFFNLIIFHSSAVVQIAACLVLSALVYLLNKPILARKII